ncbi:MAG: MmcQ/YjbR family DNA-binding protein [Clostridia bacterium]|nr:MmcQ/YjbR family DNA-binding protein [Clostridia bacterium]
MSIESEVFKRTAPDFSRLAAFGFVRTDGGYTYSETIMDGAFRADVFVDDGGNVTGRVFDTDSGEEYLPIHAPLHTGAFVGAVREEYEAMLGRIAAACFIKTPFMSDQANRITRLIYEKYGESPDNPFKNAEGIGVLRCPDNRKWYALIMPVERSKLKKEGKGESGDETVEVVNLKTDPEMHGTLIKTAGIYPAYHMNHKSWASVLLDGTLPDDRIIELIEISRGFAANSKKATARAAGQKSWIIPANPRYFDVDAAFESNPEIIWKQSSRICVGDIVYLYVGAPVSAVRYKCVVTAADMPYDYSDENIRIDRVMKIKRQKTYPPDVFKFERLKGVGINTVRGPRLAPERFLNEIEKL